MRARDREPWKRYRVWMRSRPAIGRTFYDGHADVDATDDDDAAERAIDKVARVHGHRDWVVDRIETIPRRAV